MKPVKLLIADVDGTLVTRDKVLTARAFEAVGRLRAAGIQFAITSGRPPRGMAMITEPLGLTTPIAAFNGGMLVRPDLKTVIEQRTIPFAIAKEVVDYFLQSGLDVWVYRGADWFIRSSGAAHVAFEQRTVQFGPTIVRDLYSVLDRAVKIVGVSDDAPRIVRCEAELRQRVGARASVSRSQPYYIDVTHPDANKGMVVRMASRFFHIPLHEIAVIGDGLNDMLMFEVAGTSIAMGNASPEVRHAAQHVTSSNEEDGFADAIDRFILAEPR